MKVLISIVIGLLVVGCGKTEPLGSGSEYNAGLATDQNTTKAEPAKELFLEEKVVGEYEIKEGESSRRLVLLDNGFAESYTNGKKEDRDGKWKISKEGEIHVTDPDGGIIVCRINKDGSITGIAKMDDGKREDLPKEWQVTAKKIK